MTWDRRTIRGVSEPLPPGERILWEGGPTAAPLRRHLLFLRPIAGYFVVMIGWWLFSSVGKLDPAPFWTMLTTILFLTGMVIGAIVLTARLIVSSTTYAITDRRVVLRIGFIFPMTVNIPLRYIQGASVKHFPDRTGQIALQLSKGEKLAWLALWPHARTFQFGQPEPLLLGLSDVDKVGEILRAAVLADTSAEQTTTSSTSSPLVERSVRPAPSNETVTA